MSACLAVFLISFAVLAYEVLLVRLLSIVQWHHFAFMIISLAMLGFGASGTFVSILQKHLIPLFPWNFACSSILFSFTAPLGFVLLQHMPLNPLEILWDPSQPLYLLLAYLMLALPFFFAANCIILLLFQYREKIHRIYWWDLLGAGSGAAGIILLLFSFPPQRCLTIVSALGFPTAGLVLLADRSFKGCLSAGILFGSFMTGVFLWGGPDISLHVSDYKGLSLALRVPGVKIEAERSSPLGYLTVVSSPAVPFRYAPGLSLHCPEEVPSQLAVFIDGDSMTPITRDEGGSKSLKFLDCLTGALPYYLLDRPDVLVLGAGGGMDVQMAHLFQAARVTAVELDRGIVDLVKENYASYSGHVYAKGKTEIHVAEARSFVAGTRERYDLIQITLLDSFNTAVSGGYALSESYLYTVEAFENYLAHLKTGGMLAITRWVKVPPRDSLKLFVTALVSLERAGVEDPWRNLAIIRSFKTTTLLVRNGPIREEDIGRIKQFCEGRGFDVDYYPNMPRSEANRFNIIEEPVPYDAFQALVGSRRADFMADYKFSIEPATDDRPYFSDFTKWKTLAELFSLRGQGGLPLMEWAFPILLLTLVQALFIGLVLIVLPLRTLGGMPGGRIFKLRVALYFLCLGCAFIFVEMAFIQKFVLFLGRPVYAVAVILSGFLVFAGLGSGCSVWWQRTLAIYAGVWVGASVAGAVIGITLSCLGILWVLPLLYAYMAGVGEIYKIFTVWLLTAPLAFFMGMPFPLGLGRVRIACERLIPWAWGINGCASVVSAVLALLLAIHWGFEAVVIIAMILYILAVCIFWKPFDGF